MKPMLLNLIINCLLITTSANASGVVSDAKFEKINLRTCNQTKKCLLLKANKAESGSITPIISLKNYKVEITEHNKTRQFSGTNGYMDFDNNQIVLLKDDKSQTLIELSDLSERDY